MIPLLQPTPLQPTLLQPTIHSQRSYTEGRGVARLNQHPCCPTTKENILLTFPVSETTCPNLWAEAAFRTVMSDYQQLRPSVGTMKATTYDRANEAGKVTNAGRSCLIRPTPIDFICDVEVNARRVLSPAEFQYFCTFYASCAVVVLPTCDLGENDFDSSLDAYYASLYEGDREAVAAMDLDIRRKMGERFVEVGIFGLSDYLSPVDVSGRTLSDGTRPRRSILRHPAPKKISTKKIPELVPKRSLLPM